MKKILTILFLLISTVSFAQMGIVNYDTIQAKKVQADSALWIQYLENGGTDTLLTHIQGKIAYVLPSQLISDNVSTFIEAQTGIDNSTIMTPLRVAEQIRINAIPYYGAMADFYTDYNITADTIFAKFFYPLDTLDFVVFPDTLTKIATRWDLTQISVSDLVEVAQATPGDNDVISYDAATNSWIITSQESGGGTGSGYISEIGVVGGGLSPLYDIYQDTILRAKTIQSLTNDITVGNGSTSIDFTFNPSNVLLTEFNATGFTITESQISNLDHFTNADETDPIYSAWNKNYFDLINRPNFQDSISTYQTDNQQLSIDSLNRVFTITLEDGDSVQFEDSNTQLSQSEVNAFEIDPIYIGDTAQIIYDTDIISEQDTGVSRIATIIEMIAGINNEYIVTPLRNAEDLEINAVKYYGNKEDIYSDYDITIDSVFASNHYEFVENETPSGLVNGTNATFTTTYEFEAGSTEVFLNGVKQILGVNYIEEVRQIVFIAGYEPYTNDYLRINYKYQ